MFRAAFLLVVLASAAAGCTKAQARTEPVRPEELLPPPPPPRVIEQYQPEEQPPVEPSPTEMPIDVPPARVAPKPPAPKPDAVVKPEPPPEPQRPATPAPSLTLKPVPGSQSTTEASIKDLLGRATRDLGRVNYASLTGDGKAQYDSARRFVQQSEDALRNGNVVFAGKLADKAATLAALLVR